MRAEEHEPVVVRASFALPLALIVLIPLLVGLGFAVRESHVRSGQNRALIRQVAVDERRLTDIVRALERTTAAQARSRIESHAQIAASDLQNCSAIERLKGFIRQTVREGDSGVDALVGKIPGFTAADAAAAHERNARSIARFSARRGGCGSLPSADPEPLP